MGSRAPGISPLLDLVGATVGGLFTNTFFGFFRAYIFIAVFAAAGSTIGSYDVKDAVTYSFVTQSVLMMLYFWGWWDIALSIRTGDVVTDLFRPYDYQLWWLSQDLGRAFYHLISRGIVPFVVGALVFDLRVPRDPITWVAFFVSVFLAVIVSFGIRFILNLLVFWTLDHRGVAALATVVWNLLSGFVVPLAFFPDASRRVLEILPFAMTLQVPLDIFLEKMAGSELLISMLLQAAWAVALLLIGRAILAIATKRVVTQGG